MMNARYRMDSNHSNMASSLENTAVCYRSLGKIEEALSLQGKSLEMNRALFGTDSIHPDIALSLNNIGSCHQWIMNPPKK